jgi:hypothetical protein
MVSVWRNERINLWSRCSKVSTYQWILKTWKKLGNKSNSCCHWFLMKRTICEGDWDRGVIDESWFMMDIWGIKVGDEGGTSSWLLHVSPSSSGKVNVLVVVVVVMVDVLHPWSWWLLWPFQYCYGVPSMYCLLRLNRARKWQRNRIVLSWCVLCVCVSMFSSKCSSSSALNTLLEDLCRRQKESQKVVM